MDIIDCRPILESMQGDFKQLHHYIVKAQSYISSWQLRSQTDHLLFEVPSELLEPLENLSELLFSLLDSTSSSLNNKQLKALTSQLYAIAFSYCFIQEFIRLNCNSKGNHEDYRNQAELEKLIDQFYLYANSELRTPITSLHMFSLMFKMRPSDYLISPLVPNHKETLAQIDHWIEQVKIILDDFSEQIKR